MYYLHLIAMCLGYGVIILGGMLGFLYVWDKVSMNRKIKKYNETH